MNGKWEGTWDIAVPADGELIETGISASHLDKGMIYQVFPNPFVDGISIKFGVLKPSRVSFSLFDAKGKRVDHLEKGSLPANKYDIEWKIKETLKPGHYVLTIKINDLQVQYLKVLKI